MAQSLEGGYGRSIAAGGIRAEGSHGSTLDSARRRFAPALESLPFKKDTHEKVEFMDRRQSVAVAIALQTHVLRTCPLHDQLFCDEEADSACAFALAEDLVRHDIPYVRDFRKSTHELTELLRGTIAAAPLECPQCAGSAIERST